MKVTEKVKKFYKDHETEIEAGVLMLIPLGAMAIGYVLGDTISEMEFNNGMGKMHEVGLIKFMNPVTGVEITTGDEFEAALHDTGLLVK